MIGRDSAILECWTTLTALGAVTRKLRLGALGLTPEFRHPALSAKMIATFDNNTNGRFDYIIRGIWTPDSWGVNHWGVPTSDEFDSYNVPWDREDVKIARASELVDLSQRLWTENNVSFEGKFHKVQNAVCNPKPLQKPRPPIIVEGDEEVNTLRLAAKLEGWCGAGSPALMKRKAAIVEKYCTELHKDPKQIRHAWVGYVLTGRTDSDVQEKKKRIRIMNPNYPFDNKEFQNENLFGSPKEVVSKVKQFMNAGVNYFAIFFLDYPSTDSMEIFAEDVLPQVRD
jgi:alkanesulfonate monooxygenase SsuD/methylene tetrahydromethanopterin reductase-like flavin-dependent oxidoreductase (luciferase family)